MDKRRFAGTVASLVILFLTVGAGGDREPFSGNTQTRVFHQSTCRYYSCKNCTAQFATAQEAIRNGYRPCGICEPGDVATSPSTAADAAYVGNTNTHKFHRSTCRYAGCSHCTAKFRSRSEAMEAGYVPGGCCKP